MRFSFVFERYRTHHTGHKVKHEKRNKNAMTSVNATVKDSAVVTVGTQVGAGHVGLHVDVEECDGHSEASQFDCAGAETPVRGLEMCCDLRGVRAQHHGACADNRHSH